MIFKIFCFKLVSFCLNLEHCEWFQARHHCSLWLALTTCHCFFVPSMSNIIVVSWCMLFFCVLTKFAFFFLIGHNRENDDASLSEQIANCLVFFYATCANSAMHSHWKSRVLCWFELKTSKAVKFAGSVNFALLTSLGQHWLSSS